MSDADGALEPNTDLQPRALLTTWPQVWDAVLRGRDRIHRMFPLHRQDSWVTEDLVRLFFLDAWSLVYYLKNPGVESPVDPADVDIAAIRERGGALFVLETIANGYKHDELRNEQLLSRTPVRRLNVHLLMGEAMPPDLCIACEQAIDNPRVNAEREQVYDLDGVQYEVRQLADDIVAAWVGLGLPPT